MLTREQIEEIQTECRLLSEGDSNHFMTRRFDRTESGEKIHVQTLAGLTHMDRDARHSYEEIFRVSRIMKLPVLQQEELFRRMVFNIMARNHDDHTKNFSFIMQRDGKWRLAPAYDLCYSYNPGGKWTARHQLSANGKQENFTLNDIKNVGENMGIRRWKEIFEEVRETVSNWEDIASECGVNDEYIKLISDNLLIL